MNVKFTFKNESVRIFATICQNNLQILYVGQTSTDNTVPFLLKMSTDEKTHFGQ